MGSASFCDEKLSKNPAFQSINIQSTIPATKPILCGYSTKYLKRWPIVWGSVVSTIVNTLFILVANLPGLLLNWWEEVATNDRADYPEEWPANISSLLVSLNQTVSRYIGGFYRCLDYWYSGLCGYNVIGLKHALVFAIFSALASLIPLYWADGGNYLW